MANISVDEAAARLKISPQAVRSLLSRGYLSGALEPFGPGKRWVVSASSVAARVKKQRENRLPKGGRPRKPKADKEIKNLEKSGSETR